MSKQAWAIVAKVRDVDRELTAGHDLHNRVKEVHPEVSFCAWAGQPMKWKKTSREGRRERRLIVEDYFGADAFQLVRKHFPVKQVGHDDILDAFAALWSAERVLRGESSPLPAEPSVDSCGIRMEIVY